jgi:protein-glutamine gamma-glutamyltransferase
VASSAQVSREPLRAAGGGALGAGGQGASGPGAAGARAAGSRRLGWGAAAWSPLVWTSLALSGGVLLHADRVPLWVTAIAFALIAWRVGAVTGFVRLPGKLFRALIAFALVGGVLARFHTLNGLNPGTALLVMMAAVKLLETFTRRDQYVVLGGTLFLLLAACLDRQGLLRAPLYLLEVWLCCAAFGSVAYSAETVASGVNSAPVPRFDNRAAVLLAGRALVYAIPLAIVLFVFFPRIPGAFWSLPRSEDAETGLSDSMSPGSISQLTSSYEIAFRAKFDGALPPPQQRYWRGPVLHEFDGYTWKRRPDTRYLPQQLEYGGPAYHYRVTLEPSEQRWWFTLDTVDHSPDPNVFFSYDYELVARNPVSDTTSYNATSHTMTRSTQPLSRLARDIETQWAKGRNPRSLELARTMRGRVNSDGEFIAAVLKLFHTGGFVYSLTPPLLDYNSVDDFIFNTRSGFCGHYASAFVTLMRGGGVPARVVTGYLGGEWNPIGSYFVVRQSDAHSWAEVWLDGRGWMRVDPTAEVEPDRLTRGLLDLMPQAGSAGTRLARASPGLTALLQRWDAINTWWTNNVLKFDYRSQLNLLSRLGFSSPDLEAVGWAFATALVSWLGWIAWQMSRGAPQVRPDRLARAYARLCRKLARAGLPRPAHQGPIAYAEAVGKSRPDLGETVRSLLTRYAELRYGAPRADSRAAEVAGFEKAVARLSVARPR